MLDLTVYVPYLAPALVTGLASWIAAQRMARSNEKIASGKRADDDRRERIDASATHADDLTLRFKVLMDGYEGRIRDLTMEVQTLRQEVTRLRLEIEHRHDETHDGTD